MESGQKTTYDFAVHLLGGKIAFFSATPQPVTDIAGKVIKLFGMVQDVTTRKKIKREGQELLKQPSSSAT